MTDNTNLTLQSEQRIRERAYEIYLARGGQNGDEVSDWLAAERELKESKQQKGKKTGPRPFHSESGSSWRLGRRKILTIF